VSGNEINSMILADGNSSLPQYAAEVGKLFFCAADNSPVKSSHGCNGLVRRLFTGVVLTARYLLGLSGKFPNVQNSPPLRRPSEARQVLLSSNEFDELRHENRIALSCLSHCVVLLYVIT
jgi:hypothetical protein